MHCSFMFYIFPILWYITFLLTLVFGIAFTNFVIFRRITLTSLKPEKEECQTTFRKFVENKIGVEP